MISWKFTCVFVGNDSNLDGDKLKSNGLPPNRGRKRQLKSNDDGDAWGRLLSQCSQVCVIFFLIAVI